MDSDYGTGTRTRLLHRWPGDEWVDFIGMDCYHGTNTGAYRSNLNTIVDIGKEKGKPTGVTETGIEGVGSSDYWTKQQLEPMTTLKLTKGSTVSMVVMWRNDNRNMNHFYGPSPGHSSAPDFVTFYEDPITIFSGDLPDMYK
jgi:mannan endo-1,4-beta-mannosidase